MRGASLGRSASWWLARTLREVTSRSPLRTRSCAPACPGADRRDPSVAVALIPGQSAAGDCVRGVAITPARGGRATARRRERSPRPGCRDDRICDGAIVRRLHRAPPPGRKHARRRPCGWLAERTGLERQQALRDLPRLRRRVLEPAEPACTKRRVLLLILRPSGSPSAADSQAAEIVQLRSLIAQDFGRLYRGAGAV